MTTIELTTILVTGGVIVLVVSQRRTYSRLLRRYIDSRSRSRYLLTGPPAAADAIGSQALYVLGSAFAATWLMLMCRELAGIELINGLGDRKLQGAFETVFAGELITMRFTTGLFLAVAIGVFVTEMLRLTAMLWSRRARALRPHNNS